MLGCHQGAFYPTAAVARAEPALARSCALSYARVLDFMRAVGTAFDPSHAELKPLSPANQLAEMEAEVSSRSQAATYRAAHAKAALGQPAACILRHASAPLLNQAHLALLSEIAPDDARVSAGWEGGAPRFLLEVCRPAGARSAK